MHGLPHRAGWAEFAGGYAIQSPLGTIWSTNITPSKSAGIGDYSADDFARAVRDGKAKDGSHLYPAMPYDACAGITDEDIAALYAYFMQGVAPVDAAPAQQTRLDFPFNLRFAMIGWNLFYAGSAPFAPDPARPKQRNGANTSPTCLPIAAVATRRAGGPVAPLAKIQPYLPAAVAVLLILRAIRRRRRRFV